MQKEHMPDQQESVQDETVHPGMGLDPEAIRKLLAKLQAEGEKKEA